MPRAIIYVAPVFRYTHFQGKQVVALNRRDGLHELFSYNLYPGAGRWRITRNSFPLADAPASVCIQAVYPVILKPIARFPSDS